MDEQRTRRWSVLVALLVATCGADAGAQDPHAAWTAAMVAKRGDAAPGGGVFALDPLLDPAVCARGGRTAFVARVTGAAHDHAVFCADSNGLRVVARGSGTGGGSGIHGTAGDATPIGGTFGGLFSGVAFAPAMDERGDVLFLADVRQGRSARALFCGRMRDASLVAVAAVGDAAPGGGVFASVGTGVFLPRGGVLFLAQRNGVASAELFMWRDGVTSPFVLVGDALPQGGVVAAIGTESMTFVDGTSIPTGPLPSVDACSAIAFCAHGGNASQRGIVVRENGVDAWWARAGDSAPGAATFVAFGAPLLGRDEHGGLHCAFYADCASPNGPTAGWFVGRPGAWRRALGFFDPVDGGQCLGLAISRGPMTPFDGRDLVVWCDLSIQGGSDRVVLCREDGSREVLARRGDPAPSGGTLGELTGWPSLDGAGRCIVSAQVLGGASLGAHFAWTDPLPRASCSPCAGLGDGIVVTCSGSPGASFVLGASPIRAWMPMPPLGALAIGPDPIWLLTGVEAAGQSGMWSRHWPLPDDALLAGMSLHFQSLVLDAGAMRFSESARTQLVR